MSAAHWVSAAAIFLVGLGVVIYAQEVREAPMSVLVLLAFATSAATTAVLLP